MRYLSLFSGIEAATVAWEPLGWEAVGFAEFEDFPKAVLAHHYPDVPDLGDVTQITEEQIKALGHIDIVVGGSPCQDLSVAGKRAGLRNDDGSTTRSGLFDEQMRIFEIARKYCGARYCLWENVPGAFSSNNGNDFRYVLESMVGGSVPLPPDKWKNSGVAISGDGRRLVEWRVLDAQNFGVPQRRRRIFALLDTGAWWSRQPILFEQEGMLWDSAKSRDEGKGIAERAEGSVGSGSAYAAMTGQTGSNGLGISKGILCSEEKTFTLSTVDNMRICMQEVWSVDSISSNSMKSNNPHSGFHKSKVIKTLDTSVPDPSKNQGGHIIMEKPIAFMGGQGSKAGGLGIGNQSPTLKSTNSGGNTVPCVLEPNTVVRRLTPVECERLQGFPDNYTNIPWANKPTAPDSRRYKAIGNSMAVPVMRWIGKRMMDAKEVVYDEEAIDRILYVTPTDDGQLSLF